MAQESGSRRREKAAQARDAQAATEKRRERMVRIIGAVVVVAVVLAIVGIAVFAKNSGNSSADSSTAAPNPSAALPTGVYASGTEYEYGLPTAAVKDGVPTLQLWEDFQCPACGQLEKANGTGIEKLAADGKINLVYRPTTFLDNNLKNDASKRATSAWGCAVDAGKALEFHNYLFANQPANEGDGWTDEQLLQFGSNIGLTGDSLKTYQDCYNTRKYLNWAVNSTDVFNSSGIGGTPSGFLNGNEIDIKTLADQAALEQAIADAAAGGGSASPSASPAAS